MISFRQRRMSGKSASPQFMLRVEIMGINVTAAADIGCFVGVYIGGWKAATLIVFELLCAGASELSSGYNSQSLKEGVLVRPGCWYCRLCELTLLSLLGGPSMTFNCFRYGNEEMRQGLKNLRLCMSQGRAVIEEQHTPDSGSSTRPKRPNHPPHVCLYLCKSSKYF